MPLALVGGHGGDWEGEHPLAVARAFGDEQVFLAGWRLHGLLPQALNAADLLVLPSVSEAFGLVLIEAMACGLPVIAAAAPGPAEIVAAGTGWLARPAPTRMRSQRRSWAWPRTRRSGGAGAPAPTATARSSYGWPVIAARSAALWSAQCLSLWRTGPEMLGNLLREPAECAENRPTMRDHSVGLWDCLLGPELDAIVRPGERRRAVAVATNLRAAVRPAAGS